MISSASLAKIGFLTACTIMFISERMCISAILLFCALLLPLMRALATCGVVVCSTFGIRSSYSSTALSNVVAVLSNVTNFPFCAVRLADATSFAEITAEIHSDTLTVSTCFPSRYAVAIQMRS